MQKVSGIHYGMIWKIPRLMDPLETVPDTGSANRKNGSEILGLSPMFLIGSQEINKQASRFPWFPVIRNFKVTII